MKISSKGYLKEAFILGFILDELIAINWLLIVIGIKLPSILSGHIGSGFDYQFAMYISTVFMAGWGILMLWASFKPIERRGLMLVTALLILISIISEIIFYSSYLSGPVFIFGFCKRIVLVLIFSSSYFISIHSQKKERR